MPCFRPRLPETLMLVLLTATAAWAGDTSRPLDPAELDRSALPCVDLDRFVNARWLAAHPIPPDEVRWGVFDQLTLASLGVQHEIAEDAVRAIDAPGTEPTRRQLGLLYRAGGSKCWVR